MFFNALPMGYFFIFYLLNTTTCCHVCWGKINKIKSTGDILMEIGTCNLTTEEIITALEAEKTMILATAANNRVTTRAMSHVNDGLVVYFQTGREYLKSEQIRANPNVAISVGGHDIEGIATLLGHPLDEENSLFAKLYKEKHPQFTKIWSTYPEEIVVKVEIKLAKNWRYVNGKAFIAVWYPSE